MSAISQLRLKVAVDGAETRRFALDAPVNFLRLRQLIENLLQVQKFSIFYTDDEGEQVTIACEADLKEAIAIMEESHQKALKLVVQTKSFNSDSPVTDAVKPLADEKSAPVDSVPVDQSPEEQKGSFDSALGYLLMQFGALNTPDAQAEIVQLGIILQSTAVRLEQEEVISWDGLLQQIQAQCPSIASLTCFKEEKSKLLDALQVVAKFFGDRVESGLLYPVPPHLEALMVAKSENFLNLVSKMPGIPQDVKSLLESFKNVVSKIESVGVSAGGDEKVDNTVHVGVQCDGCQMNPIVGNRYKCTACHNFDLCENCEASGSHPADHEFIKFKVAVSRGGRRFGGMFGGGHHGFGGPHHGFGGHHGHHGFGGPHGGHGGCRGGRRWRNSQCPWNKRAEPRDASPAVGVELKEGMGAEFLRDVNIEDKSRLGAGQMHVKTWSLRNDGKVDWDNTVRLVYVSGNREVLLDGQEQFEVPLLKSNETGDVHVPIVVPETLGAYKTVFRLAKNGEQFGHYLWIEFTSE